MFYQLWFLLQGQGDEKGMNYGVRQTWFWTFCVPRKNYSTFWSVSFPSIKGGLGNLSQGFVRISNKIRGLLSRVPGNGKIESLSKPFLRFPCSKAQRRQPPAFGHSFWPCWRLLVPRKWWTCSGWRKLCPWACRSWRLAASCPHTVKSNFSKC